MDNKKTGEFIANLRKEKQLTQKELAEKLFVTDRAVSKWERGIGYPDIKIIVELAKILDVEINDILYGEKVKDNKRKKNILSESISFYQKVQKQNILKKCLIFIPIGILMFFFSLMIFTELTRGVMPLSNGNMTMAHWPSFSKYANQRIANKFFKALINYDYETMEKLIYPSDAKSINRYIEDFKTLENNGIKFSNFKYTAESWGESDFTGYYDIEIIYNGKKSRINVGITKLNSQISFGGIGYMLGQDLSDEILEIVIYAFSIDFDALSR